MCTLIENGVYLQESNQRLQARSFDFLKRKDKPVSAIGQHGFQDFIWFYLVRAEVARLVRATSFFCQFPAKTAYLYVLSRNLLKDQSKLKE